MTTTFLNHADSKSSALKQAILGKFISEGTDSIADISRDIGVSIPTITKLVGELIDDGLIEEAGKLGTTGGRRPSIYGLNPAAGHIAGVEIRSHHISVAITNFKGEIIDFQDDIPCTIKKTEESFREFCGFLKDLIDKTGIDRSKILAYGFNLSGRVNNETGYCFSYFISEHKPLSEIFREELEANVFVENDSRAMTYGEYISGIASNERNILFLNVSWGLGMGMVIDGKLSYGKSGFSGEIGHFPMLNNEQICQCGKTGCLETGASGSAAHRIVMEKLAKGRASILSETLKRNGRITLEDIIGAVNEEDVLAIEVIEEIGRTLGCAIAGLINLFNPELVVIGGKVAAAKDYLMLPVKSAVQKHSLNVINRDTTIKLSRLGKKCGPLGACLLTRSKMLGLL
ncbi:MAG: ROK family protein [Candidatus Cryptobacteroides sp.]